MFESSGVKDVVLPDSLELIGNVAFYCCEKLTSICLPKSLEIMGESCFEFSGLRSVTISGSVREMGGNALANCFELETVIISDGAQIGDTTDPVLEFITGAAAVHIPDDLRTDYRITGCDNATLTPIPLELTLASSQKLSDLRACH